MRGTLSSMPVGRVFLLLSVVAACAVSAAPGGAAQRSLATGVVDVNTTLRYQGGTAAGTGMLLTSSGEVLTNNHVIRGATAIRVTIPGGRTYRATVVGYSVANDVAVLRLKASGLPTVLTGNSAKVRVGQSVTAVGNAGGVGGAPSAARGKVTAVGRTITASADGIAEQLTGLIRTDAALKPGDSGGPLLNARGRVIGMDTAASVGFAFRSSGDGYAIPINKALALARQITAGRSSATVHIGSTPFLGLSVPTRSDVSGGAVVSDVLGGGPADKAGIVRGDTITSLNGRAINSYGQLTKALLAYNAGAKVSLGIVDELGNRSSVTVHTTAGPPQ
jgi:S1-C subfamily serine protease